MELETFPIITLPFLHQTGWKGVIVAL